MKKLLPVGTKVLYNGKERTILAYTQDHYHFLVDNCEVGHDGKPQKWFDENGNEIPYVEGGTNRWWVEVARSSEYSVLPKKEPEFIFNI